MVTKIKPIKSLDDLKHDMPETLVLIHKDEFNTFTIIGEPRFNSEKVLEFTPFLDFGYIIDILETKSYEYLNVKYLEKFGQTKQEHTTFPFIYNPKEFPKNSEVILYKMYQG